MAEPSAEEEKALEPAIRRAVECATRISGQTP
jgi:hypothetical protein